MSLKPITLSVELTHINCGACGGVYAINEGYRQQKELNGGGWRCPYCQGSCGYFGQTKAETLSKQLADLEAKRIRERAWFDQRTAELREDLKKTERARRAEKAAKTRIKNRLAHGVCPCCNRAFPNLVQHLRAKHPEFTH